MSITRKDVVDAVNDMIAAEFKSGTIYRNREPTSFFRPAFFIFVSGEEREPVAKSIVREKLKISIACLPKLDARSCFDEEKLNDMRQRTISLFDRGYLKVNGETVVVSAAFADEEADRTWIEIICEYHTFRQYSEDYPRMEEINTKYRRV